MYVELYMLKYFGNGTTSASIGTREERLNREHRRELMRARRRENQKNTRNS